MAGHRLGIVSPNNRRKNQPKDGVVEILKRDMQGLGNGRLGNVLATQGAENLLQNLRPVLGQRVFPRGSRIIGTATAIQLDKYRPILPIAKQPKAMHTNSKVGDGYVPAALRLYELRHPGGAWRLCSHTAGGHQEGSSKRLSLVLGLSAARPAMTMKH